MSQWVVDQEYHDKRLDAALAAYTATPRAQIQRLIKSGAVTLNQHPVTPHAKLHAGDTVVYPELLTQPPIKKTEDAPILDILYQDEDMLVINKPAGLIVHPVGPEDANSSVVDALLELSPETVNVGDDPLRPGIVHRLDREVSGVLALAKTQRGFDHLKSQFHDRSAHKEYLALAYGHIDRDHDILTFKIARSRTLGRMVARPGTQEGKDAYTAYDVLERFKTATYVRVETKTGRTHQIRAHFKAINHPLVGDKLYKNPRLKNISPIPLERIFLHATKLTLTLLNGKERTFEIPLPDELRKLLTTLPKI